MKYVAIPVAVMLAVVVLFVLNGGLHDWKYGQTVDGIEYKRVRSEKSRTEDGVTLTIGELAAPVEVDGIVFEGWLQRRDNGTVTGGLTATDTVINGLEIPARTWVSFDSEGHLKSCHFPANCEIQGQLCRGTDSGSKGPVVVFYPNGKLKEFFAPQDVVIENVPCAGGLFDSIRLHKNGRLQQCTLTESTTIQSVEFPAGTRLSLDPDGQLIP